MRESFHRGRRVAAIVAIVLPMLVSAACGKGDSEASCPLAIAVNGMTYHGHETITPPTLGRSAGTAEIPSCDDGNGDPVEKRSVEAYYVDGLGSDVALVVPELSETDVYLRKKLKLDDLPPEIRKLLGR